MEYNKRIHKPFNNRYFSTKKRHKLVCINCNKEGHFYRECKDPITSFGIIAFNKKCNVNSIGPIISENRYTCKNKLHIDIYPTNTIDSSNDELCYFMIQRKDTNSYVDFIRGKYPQDNQQHEMLKIYLQEMTCEERLRLKTMTFDDLWELLWLQNKDTIAYINAYNDAKKKFMLLHVQELLNDTNCNWTSPEWSFPKGKKNLKENPIQCAIREFKEETSFKTCDFQLIPSKPIIESFIGTNGVAYKHVYYLAQMNSKSIPVLNNENISEVSNFGWFTYEKIMKLIRPYDTEKKNIITLVRNILE